MSDELKIIIGADVGNFQAGVNNVVKSIGQLETELKQFEKDIKTLKGDEFTVMSGKIDGLKTSIASLKSVGSSTLPKLGEDAAKAAAGIDKLAKPAGNAGYALSTMSGVVRDLPFGFIAIQNNLPLMVDSFSNLTKTSGGVGGALKGLGQAMIGPAGIGFAFGAVTSIVTGLIQQYGTLGNALEVIFAKNKDAAESQALYNKELKKGFEDFGGEAAKIDILVKKLTDLKQPYADRQAAYVELKKIQPDILLGISEENALNGTSSTVIKNNAAQRLELLKLKIQENALTSVLNAQKVKENDLIEKKTIAEDELALTTKKVNFYLEKRGGLSASEQETLNGQIQLQQRQTGTVKDYENQLKQVTTVSDSYYSKLETNLGSISAIDAATQKALDGAKADEEEKKKQTKAAEDLASANDKAKLSVEQLAAAQIAKALKESQVKQLVERNAIQGTPQTNFDRQVINAGDTAGAVTSFQGSPIAQGLLDEAAAAAAARTEYEKYAASVSTLVAPAIDQLFTAFEQGKNIFQALGDTIKSLVIDIAKAIIKATILKAITTAVSAGSGAGFFGGLFNALAGGLSGVAAPSFGGGASLGGGLALNGQVVFVQRGTDLVGVLNKGNSQINRVG